MTLSELRRIADAGFRLPTFARVSRYLNDTRRRGEIPDAESVVLRLLTWAGSDRYRELLRWELPVSRSRDHGHFPNWVRVSLSHC